MGTALEAIRNVAFVGHPSAGKTTVVDSLAYQLKAVDKRPSVAEKRSLCDTEPEEQEKGHTLQTSLVQVVSEGIEYTFIDTPGYPDFMADAQSSMVVADLVVGVVSASSGVTHNLKRKLEMASSLGRARAIVVTHLDLDNTDFDALVRDLRQRIGEVCVPVLVPDQSGRGFSAVHTIFSDEGSAWRAQLMDRIMDGCEDEKLFERYLETQTLTEDELRANIPGAMAKGKLVPVLVVNPATGLGMDKLLDFLHDFAPHAGMQERRSADGKAIDPSPEGVLAALVFSVRSDPHVGKLCVARLLRGTMHSHDTLIGPKSSERGEKLGGLFRLVGGKRRDPIETAKAGQIVALTKIEQAHYGECVTHVGQKALSVEIPAMPTPMVAMAVVPKSRNDEQKIGEALHKLAAEDPTFTSNFNPQTHELVVHGMSELHLQIMEARLKRRHGVEITSHVPRVHYKETITKSAEGQYRHKKQTGGRGQFAECHVRVRPLEKGGGLRFTDGVVGGSIPRNLIPAVEKGMRELATKGVLTHSEVVDLDFEVHDGKYHDVDSDEASFKIAGARAFMDAFKKAGPVLLEPVMELVISIPTEHAGTVFSDITSHRRGQVVDQWNEADGALTVIKAHAPLSAVQTYQRDLKSQTAGEGTYVMALHDYSPVPAQEQARILGQFSRKHEED
ncbi:MAG: elongation factor G [Planctomycetota bacterium]